MTTRTELLKRAPASSLPKQGERVLCAVSGGLDSMCLLFMLEAWCKERGGQVAATHFNHRLRGGAADRDEEFVRETCAREFPWPWAGRTSGPSLRERAFL